MADISVSVVVPWYPQDVRRVAAWAWLQARWEQLRPDWEIVTAESKPGVFNTAEAINLGVTRASGDIVVVAYADTLIDNIWLDAVPLLSDGLIMVPMVCGNLGRFPTTDLIALEPDTDAPSPYANTVESRQTLTWTGVCAAPRSMFETIRFDERFDGWGHEGEAWLLAHETLGASIHRVGAAIHLWHPDRPEGTWGSHGADRRRWLYEAYVAAHEVQDVHAMRRLCELDRHHPRMIPRRDKRRFPQ